MLLNCGVGWLLTVPWTARRSNQPILMEISPKYSLEGLMLKLKLQYFGHLMRRSDSLEKTLMLGKIEGRRRRGPQRMRWLDGVTDTMDMSLSRLRELILDRESLVCCSPWGHKESDMAERLNWTELNSANNFCVSSSFVYSKITYWEFPGGPVVKNPHFQCKGYGSNPWSGNEIPHAKWCGQK